MVPLDAIWLIGDATLASYATEMNRLFATDHAEVRSRVRRTPNHIAARYDMRIMTSATLNRYNILARMYNALVDGLNRFVQLPQITVIIFDHDFTAITSDYENTENLIGWLIGQMLQLINSRKTEMLSFASRPLEPKSLMIKPLPKTDHMDKRFKNQRRIFNRSVENTIAKYDETCVTNVDDVRPENLASFDLSGNNLSLRGISKFWIGLNKAIESLDSGRMRPFQLVYKNMEYQMRSARINNFN